MRCYYEELGVERDSNEADIKSAYRKLALRWHPDKNLDVPEAKERFQLIQQAYEVLSDAQERAWYDNHREQILRGKNSEYEENCLDVFQYFTSTCYKGYGDDAKSFYNVYREVFQTIATEDIEFMDEEGDINRIPEFGTADSNYEDVVGPFYAYWQAYSTKKTYEWLCPYDVREIKDRYILRKVEKEMKKIVQKARKDRNEEIRNLVSFVRKRDRRVQAYRRLLEERAEANRQKQEDKRLEQLRKRQADLAAVRQNNSVFNEGYEEQLKQLEQQYNSESDEYTEEEVDGEDDEGDGNGDQSEAAQDSDVEDENYELEYVDDLYCVACNKTFKNINARANHEESKKHRENIERLRLEMQNEEKAFCDNSSDSNHLGENSEALNELHLNGDATEDEDFEEEQQSVVKRDKKNKKSKKLTAAKQLQADSESEENASEGDLKTTANKTLNHSDSDEDWSKGNSSKKAAKKSKNKRPPVSKVESVTPAPAPPPAATLPKDNIDADEEAAVTHICVTCKVSFESKNKLFTHLKKTNHGVYIPKAKPYVEGKPTNKSKSKRK